MKQALMTFVSVAALTLSSMGFAADPPAQPAWTKFTTPGESHKKLKEMEGKWTYTLSWWATPGAKPETSKGTSKSTLILGGRFLQQTAKGKVMGQDFEGMGLLGYDAFKEEYQSIWADNMATSIMWSTGTMDTTNSVINQSGTFGDPMANDKAKWFRTELKIVSKNEHTYAMFNKGADGSEFKTMEIVYKRAK
jgi:hypothetical protein